MREVIILILLFTININLKAQEKMSNNLPYSPSLRVNDLVFISGQVGMDPVTSTLKNDSFEAETKQVMENLGVQLKAHDLIYDDLVSIIVYLKDMDHFARFNEVYRTFFLKKFPTRTCIAVANLPVGASIEISGIANALAQK